MGVSLWTAEAPLILASKSASRRALLAAALLDVEAMPADVDERAVEIRYLAGGGPAQGLAAALAQAKALAVSAIRPDAYCLGADQTLILEGRLMHKASDLGEAARSLAALAGHTHELTSAFCVARGGHALGADEDRVFLTMRPLDPAQIATYLSFAGPDVIASVGAYQLEGLGQHLFEKVDGDHSTVLGLPMLKLLAWMRGKGLLALR